MVDGENLTIVWNVDDLKISHKNTNVVTDIIDKLDKKYGKAAKGDITPLTVNRGKNT